MTAQSACTYRALSALLVTAAAVTCAFAQPPSNPRPTPPSARAPDFEHALADYFESQREYRSGDLIARSDVEAILKKLAASGWEPHDPPKILDDTLPDQHPVVVLLRSEQGRRFMRKVSGFGLMYDRLDRVSQVSGGQRMLEALVRLPDGERYSRPKSQLPHGVPDFLDLLPKNSSGKVRTIRDYDKPTGRIYTADDLLARLRDNPPATSDRP